MEKQINQKDYNKSGIYKIQNNINDNFYIGCTKNIISKFRSHKYTLTNNISKCRILQNAVNKYGIENFTFSIIEICDNYPEREVYWLEELNPSYNLVKELLNKRELSESSRELMSIARKGKESPFKNTKNPNYKREQKQIVIYNDEEFTIQELADKLECSVQNIYQKIKRKKLKLKT